MKDLMRKQLIYKKISDLLLGFVFLFVTLIAPVGAAAQAQSIDSLDLLFTIRHIKVDERASKASQARRTALAKAEQQAYFKLLSKITQAEGRAKLPILSRAEQQALVSGIEVVEEHSSSRRYTATLNVRFEPASVSQFLARYGVPHVLSTGRGILVLHAHKDGLSEYLWQPNIATIQARDTVDWLNRIRQYVFPRGEMRERFAVTYREINAFDARGIKDIASLYKVPSALMISSIWDETDSGGRLRYQFLSSDGGLKASAVIDQTGPAAQKNALIQMYENVLEKIDTAWRDQLLVDTGSGGDMEVLVPTTNLQVLTDIKKRLDDVTLVQGYKILSVGLPFSKVAFHYTGREDQLRLALRYSGLTLGMYGDQRLLKQRIAENEH